MTGHFCGSSPSVTSQTIFWWSWSGVIMLVFYFRINVVVSKAPSCLAFCRLAVWAVWPSLFSVPDFTRLMSRCWQLAFFVEAVVMTWSQLSSGSGQSSGGTLFLLVAGCFLLLELAAFLGLCLIFCHLSGQQLWVIFFSLLRIFLPSLLPRVSPVSFFHQKFVILSMLGPAGKFRPSP